MDSFYVVLPSNASEDNTPSRFLTTLQKPITINNPEEWEVGLLEVNFKNALKTIYNDKIEVRKIVRTKTAKVDTEELRNIQINFTQDPVTWAESNITSDGPGTKLTRFYSYPLTEGMVVLNSDDKEKPDFELKIVNGRGNLVNNTDVALDIALPWYYMVTFGFENNAKPWLNYNLGETWIRNVQPGTTVSRHRVLTATNAEGKEVLLTIPTNYEQGYLGTYSIIYADKITVTKATISPKPGKYMKAQKLAEEFVDTEFNKFVKLEYDERQNTFKIIPAQKADELNTLEIEFIGGIHEVLGFNKDLYTSAEIGDGKVGDLGVDLERGITNIFIYCDLCQHIRVGNTTAPLLRPIAFNAHQYGDMVHTHFINPMYVPINKSFIDTIEVVICDAAGEPIPFVEGLTTIILHFKRI